MRKARFDTQFLLVFAILVALTVMVGGLAMAVNWYLVRTHDQIIDGNLPARELAARVDAQAGLIGPLTDALAIAQSDADLARAAGSVAMLLTEIEAGFEQLGAVREVSATAEPPETTLARMVETAQLATSTQGELKALYARIGAVGERLEELMSAQVDLARLRMTAGLAELYAQPFDAADPRIDGLADRYFFAFDRLAELVRVVDALRLHIPAEVAPMTEDQVSRSREEIVEALQIAQRRSSYLPSLSARTEVAELLEQYGAALEAGGAFDLQLQLGVAQMQLARDAQSLRAYVEKLVNEAGLLRDQAQARSLAEIAHADRVLVWLSVALVVFVLLALGVATLVWVYARKRLVTRLGAVSQRIVAVAEGDFETRIPISGHDEIGRMEKALNVLRRRSAEAARLRGHLEEAVLQRTGDVLNEMRESDAARAEAVEANRKKTAFLARMSHEIRTPLNGIIGMLDLLGLETPPGPGKERIVVASRSARELLEITNDILTFTSTEESGPGRGAMHFYLRSLVGQLGQQALGLAREKGLETEVDLAEGAPPVLLGDVVKIRQILINLISNAVKYTPRGSVRLRVDHATGAQPGEVVLSFAVEDTGIGLSPEDARRAFEAYGRADTAWRSGTEGVGLGLAIARQLTEAIGGGLHFESEPGQGTRFVLTVPLRLGDPAQIETESAVETNSQFDLDVLVIEDHPVNLLVARGLLEKLGCRVTDAPDGRTGLDLAAKVRFDLVLIDLGLPDIDGERVARELRARPDPPRMAALTAHLIDDTPEERERIGVDAILGKPISPRSLVRLLAEVAGAEARGVPAAYAPAPTDPVALDELFKVLRGDIDTIGSETVVQIVEAFLRDAPEGSAVVKATSGPERARAAHRLKGAASNFALHTLCARLAEIESDPDQPVTDLAELVAAARADLMRAARGLGLQLSSEATSL